MIWKKIGFIRPPETNFDWMKTNLQLPTTILLDNNNIRVFFATRNNDEKSYIGFLEIELSNDKYKIKKISDKPVLEPGDLGTFSEHGVLPTSIIFHNNKYYMYYVGWVRGYEYPMFYPSIALATSNNGIDFYRYYNIPIMFRSDHDTCFSSSATIYRIKNKWKMFYVSCSKWKRNDDGILQSYYYIKEAESEDLINWNVHGIPILKLREDETRIARPTIMKFTDNDYRMWYCYASFANNNMYRIGYAESKDGENWTRLDHLSGIGLDEKEAKSMICYPHVFKLNNRIYMLYNGDHYGREGFGIAILEE